MTADLARTGADWSSARSADNWLASAIESGSVSCGWWGCSSASLPAGYHVLGSTSAVCGLDFHPASVRTARDFAFLTLRDWGLTRMNGNAKLVASELVTNAFRHATPESSDLAEERPIQLGLLRRHSHLACMVADPSTRPPLVANPDHFSESGRGLHLVNTFSDGWGWSVRSGLGKVVWAIFTIPG